MRQRNKPGDIRQPDFVHTTKLPSSRLYGTGIKTGIEIDGKDKEPSSHTYDNPIYDKRGKNIQCRKDTMSSIIPFNHFNHSLVSACGPMNCNVPSFPMLPSPSPEVHSDS